LEITGSKVFEAFFNIQDSTVDKNEKSTSTHCKLSKSRCAMDITKYFFL